VGRLILHKLLARRFHLELDRQVRVQFEPLRTAWSDDGSSKAGESREATMAGFKTHITVSSVLGAGYGAAANYWFDIPAPTALVAAGLCGIAGILPDVDSDSGTTVREVMSFAAAVVPLLLMDHFRQAGLGHDELVLAGGCAYVVIRFGLGEILKRYTVHRGMWHSIPAALIAGLTTLFISSCDDPSHRLCKVGAVVLGYMIHLILDELYSLQLYHGRIRLKKSFGTAIKLWGDDPWGNFAVFAKLAALLYFTINDAALNERVRRTAEPLQQPAQETVRQVFDVPFDALDRR
jgi:hypothetical protein